MEQLSFDDLEAWKPVLGYEGLYEISNLGRTQSFHGRQPRILRPAIAGKGGYPMVNLARNGVNKSRTVHSLVAEAFIGPRPDGMEVRHKDGQPTNCRASNLTYGTSGDNNLDQVEHGTHNNASKDVCKNGHDYTEENTYYYHRADGSIKQRACKICRRDWNRKWLEGQRKAA